MSQFPASSAGRRPPRGRRRSPAGPAGAPPASSASRQRPAAGESVPAPAKKARNAYHHGNLRQALVDQAVATIGARGVEALTLREVGASLRVSRTALYRHFADKTALLAAVAAQGFRAFRDALQEGWDHGGRGRAGFIGMGRAYFRFALAHPSHYRVMFGGFVTKAACDPGLEAEAGDAFGVLAGAITELQGQGLVRAGDPMALGVYVWASTHGLAMLAIDGQLGRKDVPLDALVAVLLDRVWDGLARSPRA
ncbi:MAG: TetR/AcrR family transcriptional regulator [Vicinamibacterales bacterium]